MRIARFLKQTLLDYPGKLACEIFVSGCNYKCPSCHARHVVYGEGRVDEKEIFDYLDFAKEFVDGLVLSGGEPTLQIDLPQFARKLKNLEIAVKLDTNGSNPAELENLLKEKLIDYVAFDVKSPPSLYARLIGKEHFDLREYEKSLFISQNFPDYEFRTTVVPFYREDGNLDWFSKEEVEEMASWISSLAKKESEWYVQSFVSRAREEMIDEKFSRENLPKEFHETPRTKLEEIAKILFSHGFDAKVR